MAREQVEHAFAERHALVVGPAPDRSWLSEADGEPSLDELLDDPIMVLLWQADGLEPVAARSTLMGLRTLVTCGSGSRPGDAAIDGGAARSRRSLAA